MRALMQYCPQALSKVHDALLKHHPMLLAVFASYALVLQDEAGQGTSLMLPQPAWAALLEDSRWASHVRISVCTAALTSYFLPIFTLRPTRLWHKIKQAKGQASCCHNRQRGLPS